jgi:hypothetical protein
MTRNYLTERKLEVKLTNVINDLCKIVDKTLKSTEGSEPESEYLRRTR